jgi:hypothetical protein
MANDDGKKMLIPVDEIEARSGEPFERVMNNRSPVLSGASRVQRPLLCAGEVPVVCATIREWPCLMVRENGALSTIL